MEDFGKVSVITPSYNCERFIGEMIESVLCQTYQNWELIITDDCSTDHTRDIINDYTARDSRIRLFCLEKNSGAGVARNKSIEKAIGRFIAFLDSDDKWMPQKLEKQLCFMVEHKYAFSSTGYMVVNEKDVVLGLVIPPKVCSFFSLKCDDKVGFSTAIYDTSMIPKTFMPTIRKRQDWGLVLKLVEKCGRVYGMKEPLGYYRKGHQSLSKNKTSLIYYNLNVYREVLGWSYPRAILFFMFLFLPSYFIKKAMLYYINK